MALVLRPFADTDVDAVLAVWDRASQVGHPFLPADFVVAERERLATRWLPTCDTVVAEDDGAVVGFVSTVGDEVGGLFVDPARHRQGIGRRLLAHAMIGHRRLELGVFEANEGARRFYATMGFREVGPGDEVVAGHHEVRMELLAPGTGSARGG